VDHYLRPLSLIPILEVPEPNEEELRADTYSDRAISHYTPSRIGSSYDAPTQFGMNMGKRYLKGETFIAPNKAKIQLKAAARLNVYQTAITMRARAESDEVLLEKPWDYASVNRNVYPDMNSPSPIQRKPLTYAKNEQSLFDSITSTDYFQTPTATPERRRDR